MGLKPRARRRGKTAVEVVEGWLAESGASEAHVYRRELGGVSVLMFVAGDDVTAETGVGLGVQTVIAAEIAAQSGK